jgi:acetyltransferase-like isoleucine patch superfamily enzyme
MLVWLLPGSELKNKLLRMFGHDIAPSARIGPVLALNVGRAVVGEDTTIAALNTFRSLRLLKMGNGATMGSFNMISAHPAYQALDPDVGCLTMGNGAIMTSRHYVDCSGIVQTGDFSSISGQRTTILSHELNLSENVQTAGHVILGDRSVLSTNCVVLKGAILPPLSALAANSTLTRAKDPNPAPGIYAGSPAKYIKSIPPSSESWYERQESVTTELRVDPRLGLVSDGTGEPFVRCATSSRAEKGLYGGERRLG